ncbi:MAG: hypothetical protein JXA71_00910 [Chitinispirillaceae bacterium]|nr:hypothetical protein [Chitinispirillaceae bacterium]
MRYSLALTLITGILSGTFSQTNIGGNLGGMTLDSAGNPYVVDRDIIIPKGKYLIINAGCNLLFNPFTGITVQGNLQVNGTQEHPVLFSSINDTMLNPEAPQSPDAFDWNGILVAKESGDVEVKFANLRYSVYGIKCQNPDILIMQSVFRQNGQFHFTINDKIQNVPENEPFSYNATKQKPKVGGEDRKPSVDGKGAVSPSRNRLLFRYGSLGVGVVGALGGTIFAFTAKDNFEKANSIKPDPDRPIEDQVAERQTYIDAYNTSAVLSGITFALGAAGLIGFGLSFVF